MCGIAGIHIKDHAIGKLPLSDLVNQLMLGIESRGRHAAGFVSVNKGGGSLVWDKKPIPASEFIGVRKAIPKNAKTILLHTRFATKGEPNNNNNNHPVKFRTCYAVHNGHIWNDHRPFKDYKLKRGNVQVDSIAIPAVLEHFGMDDLEAIKEALDKLGGTWAIASINPVRYKDKLLLAKGPSSPLVILDHPKCIVWASTKKAIEDAWGTVIGTPPKKMNHYTWLSEGQLWIIDGDTVIKERWKPETKHFQTSGWEGWPGVHGNGYGWDDDADEYDEWEHHGGVWVKRYKPDHSPVPRRRFVCDPTSYSCKHKCATGCSTMQCLCYEGSIHMREVRGEIKCKPTLYDCEADCEWKKESKFSRSCSLLCDCNTPKALPPAKALEGPPVDIVECDTCGLWIPDTQVKFIKEPDGRGKGNFRVWEVCESCKAQSEKEDDPWDRTKWNDKRKAVHAIAIKEVAYEMDVEPNLVDWILFESYDETDDYINKLHAHFRREYANAITIVKDIYRVSA